MTSLPENVSIWVFRAWTFAVEQDVVECAVSATTKGLLEMVA